MGSVGAFKEPCYREQCHWTDWEWVPYSCKVCCAYHHNQQGTSHYISWHRTSYLTTTWSPISLWLSVTTWGSRHNHCAACHLYTRKHDWLFRTRTSSCSCMPVPSWWGSSCSVPVGLISESLLKAWHFKGVVDYCVGKSWTCSVFLAIDKWLPIEYIDQIYWEHICK